MFTKEYLTGRVNSSVTESEKTQAEQNLLLFYILEKLNGGDKNEQTRDTSEVVKTTKGRK